jgi:hypothetical protein
MSAGADNGGGDGGGGSSLGGQVVAGGPGTAYGSAFERLRREIRNLSSYSNNRIVEIGKGFVDISKQSAAMAAACHKAFVDCLASAYTKYARI